MNMKSGFPTVTTLMSSATLKLLGILNLHPLRSAKIQQLRYIKAVSIPIQSDLVLLSFLFYLGFSQQTVTLT